MLREVLVAYAHSDNFDFAGGMEVYDNKKLEVRTKREELEEELAELNKKVQEVALGAPGYTTGAYSITGSIHLFD